MGAVSLQYKFLQMTSEQIEQFCEEEKKKVEKIVEENDCVIKYIVNKLAGRKYFIKFNELELKHQLKTIGINYEQGLTVTDIISWVKEFYANYINVYPLDALYKMFDKCTQHLLRNIPYVSFAITGIYTA